MKKLKKPIYYVVYDREVFPCYLIKEGYIPCSDYRENINDRHYWACKRGEFCIAEAKDTKNIFKDVKEACADAKNKILMYFSYYLLGDLIERQKEAMARVNKLLDNNIKEKIK